MKAVLFCANPYAFGILQPLKVELSAKGWEILWYVPERIQLQFPFKNEPVTSKIPEVYRFHSDAIFVPGNEVPHYLRGVKVQVFHGLAGEKKGHFRNRQYFDLYLTQGPYFTKGFRELMRDDKSVEITETGWPKLDVLFSNREALDDEKTQLLKQRGAKWVVLYAPTFSPSLTSAPLAMESICKLASDDRFIVQLKFHDLMDKSIIHKYVAQMNRLPNLSIIEERNIIKPMLLADLMISDTSSVVYEFLLLDKPVITIHSTSKNISWLNLPSAHRLYEHTEAELLNDQFKHQRKQVNAQYHPYSDGRSAKRMVEAVEDYIKRNGVPERRNLNFYRRWKIRKMFGPVPEF